MPVIRFSKQRDGFRCAPVVILNALKWSGVSANYEDWVPKISKQCKCRLPNGTTHKNFDMALRKFGKGIYKSKLVRKPLLKDIEKHLGGEGAVVLNYSWYKEKEDFGGRHYVFLAGISSSKKSYLMVNDYKKGSATRWCRRENFKLYNLRFQRVDPYFKAWFLTKVI